jgi:hypothetical protein
MGPIEQAANTILKYRGLSAMFMFLTMLTVSLQIEVNALKDKVAAMRRGIDRDVLSYDVRVSQAVQRLTRATFGDEAIRVTPVPPAFLQPGHQVEGEIYRFIALGDQASRGALPIRNQLVK